MVTKAFVKKRIEEYGDLAYQTLYYFFNSTKEFLFTSNENLINLLDNEKIDIRDFSLRWFIAFDLNFYGIENLNNIYLVKYGDDEWKSPLNFNPNASITSTLFHLSYLSNVKIKKKEFINLDFDKNRAINGDPMRLAQDHEIIENTVYFVDAMDDLKKIKVINDKKDKTLVVSKDRLFMKYYPSLL